MWVWASLFSHWPYFIGDTSRIIQVTNISRANEVLALIALFVVVLKSKINPKKILKYFSRVVIVAAFLSIPFQSRWISGLIPNKSMGGILIASLLFYTQNVFIFLMGVIFILLAKSSTAFLALTVVCLGAFINKGNIKKMFLCATGVGLFGALAVKDFFDAGSRWRGYQFFFRDFKWSDWLIGKGPGSFFAISIDMQKFYHFDYDYTGYWLFLHSDPLQFVFEYGILAVPFLILTLYWIGKNAQKVELLSLLAIACGGLFYYPLHYPAHLFAVFLVLKVIYDETTNCNISATWRNHSH